ncbi:RNA 3'-terminal phosphate cyclase [Penicillium rolfsii]|nr:RNA 3'-terminal phosphate cyclase [Penicillium rolfsii]
MANFGKSAHSASSGGESSQTQFRHIHLDGRTLEGGGQLVRIALGLSALTGRAVTVDHVRGNRGGKIGLKASHAAAVQLLAEISGSSVSNGNVGSKCVTFRPPQASTDEDEQSPATTRQSRDVALVPLGSLSVKPVYNIRLTTPGSVFLIFQALYPYLLHSGSRAKTECIRVNIVGGTNGTSSPSYDYVAQVVAPNFARLGLPPFTMTLHKRGWTSGAVGMGEVSFFIRPLPEPERQSKEAISASRFPRINLMNYERGKIIRITITILAPSDALDQAGAKGEALTIASYAEQETLRRLRKAMKTLDPSIFAEPSEHESHVPIDISPTEITSHASRVNILIVGHTSTGFRIGHNALFGDTHGNKPTKKKLGKHHKYKKGQGAPPKKGNSESHLQRVSDMVDDSVEGFIGELSETQENTNTDQESRSTGSRFVRRSCLDSHMRDQIVVFEALGNLGDKVGIAPSETAQALEDERYWTLHTKTAQWVCQKMLRDVSDN